MASEALVDSASPVGTKRAAPRGFGSEPGPPQEVADPSKKQRVEEAFTEHSMKVIVPNAKVGQLIGKGGSVIRHIRETTKARVDIAKATPGEADRVVTITGTQEATQMAFNVIQAKVSEEPNQQQMAATQDNGYVDVKPGELVVRQLIPDAHIGSIIGKGGTTIGGIRTQSGAKVKLSSTPEPGTTERMMTIIGTLLQCQVAQQLVSQKLLEEMGEGAYPTAAGGYDASGAAAGYAAAAGGAADPYAAAGYAAAAGGYADPNAAAAYGAQAYGAGAYGAADPYAAGAYGAAPAMGGYGMQAQVGYGQPQAQGGAPQGSMTTSEISLPDEAMGRVIGRAGYNIKEIRTVSGAQVKVVPKDGISPMRRVTLTGTAEQIASATLMIQRMT